MYSKILILAVMVGVSQAANCSMSTHLTNTTKCNAEDNCYAPVLCTPKTTADNAACAALNTTTCSSNTMCNLLTTSGATSCASKCNLLSISSEVCNADSNCTASHSGCKEVSSGCTSQTDSAKCTSGNMCMWTSLCGPQLASIAECMPFTFDPTACNAKSGCTHLGPTLGCAPSVTVSCGALTSNTTCNANAACGWRDLCMDKPPTTTVAPTTTAAATTSAAAGNTTMAASGTTTVAASSNTTASPHNHDFSAGVSVVPAVSVFASLLALTSVL